MREQRGFSAALILILIGLAFIGFVIYQVFDTFKSPAPTSRDFRVEQRDINDSRYNLVKDMYNLSPEQLEVLSTVNENDKEL